MAVQKVNGWPEGITLYVYQRALWAGPAPVAGDTPRGAQIASEAIVNPLGAAVLEGLEDETEYYVGGLVNSVWRWTTVVTPKPAAGTGTPGSPGVGVPAGGTTGQALVKKSGSDFDTQWSAGAGGVTTGELNTAVAGEATLRTNADVLKAPLASPALTGTPTAPTASPGTSTTQVATTAFSAAAVAAEAALRAAGDLLQRKVVNLGLAVEGSLKPELNEGRIFKGTMTGATLIEPAQHIPSDGTTTGWEVDLSGESAITFSGVTWVNGSQPPQQAGRNRYQFWSDDGGSTINGQGVEGLPADVVRASGTPSDKQVPTWNAGEERPVWATPASPGLSESAVNARIVAEAVPLSELPHLAKRLATAVISSGTVIPTSPLNMAYRITKAGTYALPPSASIVRDGDVLLIENGTTGFVILTGDVGNATVSQTLGPGDTATFVGDFTAAEALSISSFWHLAAFTGAQPAAWTALTLVGAKVEAGTGYAHGALLGVGASRVWLRGVVKIVAGKSVAESTKFATLPSSLMFPTSTVTKNAHNAVTGAAIPFTVNSSGELKTLAGQTIAEGVEVSFDDTPPISIA